MCKVFQMIYYKWWDCVLFKGNVFWEVCGVWWVEKRFGKDDLVLVGGGVGYCCVLGS